MGGMPTIPGNDPNEAYDITVCDRPPDWWTVTCNGIPMQHFAPERRDLAQRYQHDPAYRVSLVTPVHP